MAQQRQHWSKSLHPWRLTLLRGKFPSESTPLSLASSLWTLLLPKSTRSTRRKHSRVSSPLCHSYDGESKSLNHADPCELDLRPLYEQARGDSLDGGIPGCHWIHQRRRTQSRWRTFNGEPLIISFVHCRQSQEIQYPYVCTRRNRVSASTRKTGDRIGLRVHRQLVVSCDGGYGCTYANIHNKQLISRSLARSIRT